MEKETLDKSLIEIDIKIKKQQVELLKAQTRGANAIAKLNELEVSIKENEIRQSREK